MLFSDLNGKEIQKTGTMVFFLTFYFYFILLYNTVLVLPYIHIADSLGCIADINTTL